MEIRLRDRGTPCSLAYQGVKVCEKWDDFRRQAGNLFKGLKLDHRPWKQYEQLSETTFALIEELGQFLIMAGREGAEK